MDFNRHIIINNIYGVSMDMHFQIILNFLELLIPVQYDFALNLNKNII